MQDCEQLGNPATGEDLTGQATGSSDPCCVGQPDCVPGAGHRLRPAASPGSAPSAAPGSRGCRSR
jgi:hypothetical protein